MWHWRQIHLKHCNDVLPGNSWCLEGGCTGLANGLRTINQPKCSSSREHHTFEHIMCVSSWLSHPHLFRIYCTSGDPDSIVHDHRNQRGRFYPFSPCSRADISTGALLPNLLHTRQRAAAWTDFGLPRSHAVESCHATPDVGAFYRNPNQKKKTEPHWCSSPPNKHACLDLPK